MRIPSTGGSDAEVDVQETAAGVLGDLGLDVDRWDIDLDELARDPWSPGVEVGRSQAVGVVARMGEQARTPALVLPGHLDVVPPGDPDSWLGLALEAERNRDSEPGFVAHPPYALSFGVVRAGEWSSSVPDLGQLVQVTRALVVLALRRCAVAS